MRGVGWVCWLALTRPAPSCPAPALPLPSPRTQEVGIAKVYTWSAVEAVEVRFLEAVRGARQPGTRTVRLTGTGVLLLTVVRWARAVQVPAAQEPGVGWGSRWERWWWRGHACWGIHM